MLPMLHPMQYDDFHDEQPVLHFFQIKPHMIMYQPKRMLPMPLLRFQDFQSFERTREMGVQMVHLFILDLPQSG